MAITRRGQVVLLGAANDEIEGTVILQGVYSVSADASLTSGDKEVFLSMAAGSVMTWPEGLALDGLKYASGNGKVFVYLR